MELFYSDAKLQISEGKSLWKSNLNKVQITPGLRANANCLWLDCEFTCDTPLSRFDFLLSIWGLYLFVLYFYMQCCFSVVTSRCCHRVAFSFLLGKNVLWAPPGYFHLTHTVYTLCLPSPHPAPLKLLSNLKKKNGMIMQEFPLLSGNYFLPKCPFIHRM